MSTKITRLSFINSNKNNNNTIDSSQKKNKKYQRKTLRFTKEDYGEVLHRIKEKKIESYIKEQKEFEKKAGSIIIKHKYNHANQVQNNFYKMFTENFTLEKSHRIRLKYIEGILESNDKEILLKYYNLRDCYDKLKLLSESFDNNIIFYPNYFINENIYLIMEKFLENKEKYILRTKKDNKINYYKNKILKKRRFYRQEISNKIFESFIEDDNSIDLEDNLKNLNEESSSFNHKNFSNSSFKVKQLINNLNNNENKKERQKQLKTKIFKIITKNYDINNENTNENFKRMNSLTKPISFKENNIMQKLYLDNYLFKKYGWLNNKKKNETEVKNNNFSEKKIYFKTLSHEKINNNPINIYTYKDKNRKQNGKSLHNFKPTHLFIYNFFKQKNLGKNKKIKNMIINSINEYQTFKNQKIISFLKEKEKKNTKNYTLSSSRKRLNKNFVQGDGYTAEITRLKDIINKQKIKENKKFLSKGKLYLNSALFYNNNYNNYESMISRINTNIQLLSKNTKYKIMFPLLGNKT